MTVFRAAVSAVGIAVLCLAWAMSPASSSPSSRFDKACPAYYAQGNDPAVPAEGGVDFCACLAEHYGAAGLGVDALNFFARTYSEDLTTFIHEYPKGDAWMNQSFEAEAMCKTG